MAGIGGTSGEVTISSSPELISKLDEILAKMGGSTSNLSQGNTAAALSGVETDLLVYLVPTGKTLSLSDIFCTGDADGEFKVYANSSGILEGRTSSADRVFHHAWSRAYTLNAGDMLRITVTHHETGTENFSGYIFGSLE